MKIIVVTTCDNKDHHGWKKLEASLIRFGYHYECIVHPFAFGTQMGVIRRWAESYTRDATHMLYTDAFDTLALAGPDEVISKFPECKMLISAEKNCYPHPERAVDYPATESAWKYVNGGGWLAEIEYFKYLCNKENLNSGSHDQVWLMEAYLNNQEDIKLDTQCEIFQTIAFSHQHEWEIGGKFIEGSENDRMYNWVNDTLPIFIHGNGHTEMDWVYKILE